MVRSKFYILIEGQSMNTNAKLLLNWNSGFWRGDFWNIYIRKFPSLQQIVYNALIHHGILVDTWPSTYTFYQQFFPALKSAYPVH